MSARDSIAHDSTDFVDGAIRDGAALAAWATAVTVLVGAIMIAGVAMTAVRLRVTRWL